ncbi:hypothetical protein [Pseudomonas sp. Marseille-Q5299]|uniref:hypothetical protein n=1 Tax=Pseudomonas sp. Marseille-Q5299 TaxID=2942201 RepID=UPI002073A1A6|nr:hypothetical protein [Pseudomonas sp. Marseille-Q5299]
MKDSVWMAAYLTTKGLKGGMYAFFLAAVLSFLQVPSIFDAWFDGGVLMPLFVALSAGALSFFVASFLNDEEDEENVRESKPVAEQQGHYP